MSKLIFYLLACFLFFECSSNEDTKGEIIPPLDLYHQVHNPLKNISYLTSLMESQDGANLFYLRSKAYAQMHDYKKAWMDIKIAIHKLPNDLDYLLLSAQIKYNLELFNEALSDAKIVESSGIESPELWILFTEINIKLKKPKVANFYLSKLKILGFPKSENSYINYLTAIVSRDSLIAKVGQYVDFNQKELHPKLMRQYYETELNGFSKFKYQTLLLKSLKSFPSDPHLIRCWARFLHMVGQKNKAENVYLKSIDFFLTNSNLYFEIGQFYFQSKKLDNAISFFNLISNRSPLYKEALFLKSICFLNVGNRTKSMALLDSGIQYFPQDLKFRGLKYRLSHVNSDSLISQNDSLKTP